MELYTTTQKQKNSPGVFALGGMVSLTPAMHHVFALTEQVSASRASVLITGESGTGKELVARAIHALSPRRNGPFVAINCAAMPEALIETELFGHEKGAFTGAVERRAGCFERAQNGTLLLDEIGDMPAAAQAKLLRVLEDRKVRRLGSENEVEVDVRVIASTNRDLEDSVKKNSFREDLYFRLNVFEINLPAFRHRIEDIELVTEALIAELNERQGHVIPGIHPDAVDILARYRWPGNIRELRNVLERAAILAGKGPIEPRHLPRKLSGRPAIQSDSIASIHLPMGISIEEAEKLIIQSTLRYTKNNRSKTAEILEISLKTLINKLKKYGVSDKRRAGDFPDGLLRHDSTPLPPSHQLIA